MFVSTLQPYLSHKAKLKVVFGNVSDSALSGQQSGVNFWCTVLILDSANESVLVKDMQSRENLSLISADAMRIKHMNTGVYKLLFE